MGVLKYRFCYYSGIARPTEPKVTLEKIVAVSGRRGQDVMLGLGQEAGGVEGVGNTESSLYCGLHRWSGNAWMSRLNAGWLR